MRVARLYGVADVRVEEEPDPGPAPAGHSLIRPTAVGICGSDLHWFAEGGIGDAAITRPLILGHESAGVVVDGPLTGRRVAIDPAQPCNGCVACRRGLHNLCPAVRFAGHGETDGALRELLTWPDELLHPLPDEISDVGGAMLEPLGVAAHAIDLCRVRPGATVAVVGCGPIGLFAVQLARAAGAVMVIAVEPLPHRRRAAERFGADAVLDPDQAAMIGDVTAGQGVDVALEAAGPDDAVDVAMLAARPGGRVVLAGIPDADRTSFRASAARRKGLTILMSRRMNDAYPRAIALVRRGLIDVESVVTRRFGLADTADALACAAARTGLKTMVVMGGPT